MSRGRTLAALALAALFLLAGCSTKGEVSAQVMVWNHTGQTVPLIVKAWDHNGGPVFNETVDAAPSQAAQPFGTLTGPVSNYGGEYSFLARAGDLETQIEATAEGIASWTIHVHSDRVEFVFA